MNRRTFITGSGATIALLAGCLATGENGSNGDPGDGGDDGTDDSDDNSSDPSDDQQLYIVLTDDQEQKSPLHHNVEVLDGDIHDPDTPPRVELTISNPTDDTVTYGERREALFWSARSEDGFTLLPEDAAEAADSTYEFDEDAGYWVADDPFVTTDDYQYEELEPEESYSETLLVVVDHQEDPPTEPPEELTFAAEYRASDDADFPDEEPATEREVTLHRDDEDEYTAAKDELGDEVPLRYDVELEQPDLVAPDEPMRLEVSLTNESDEQISYGERRTALFWAGRSDEFVLHPTEALDEDGYERRDESGLWIATDEFGMTMDYQIESLEAGETHVESLLVLATPDDEGEYPETPPADLSFETSVSVERIDDEPVDDIGTEWGFTLEASGE